MSDEVFMFYTSFLSRSQCTLRLFALQQTAAISSSITGHWWSSSSGLQTPSFIAFLFSTALRYSQTTRSRAKTKSLPLPQSLSSELSSQSLSWSQTQRLGTQRRLSQRYSLSVHERGAGRKQGNRTMPPQNFINLKRYFASLQKSVLSFFIIFKIFSLILIHQMS